MRPASASTFASLWRRDLGVFDVARVHGPHTLDLVRDDAHPGAAAAGQHGHGRGAGPRPAPPPSCVDWVVDRLLGVGPAVDHLVARLLEARSLSCASAGSRRGRIRRRFASADDYREPPLRPPEGAFIGGRGTRAVAWVRWRHGLATQHRARGLSARIRLWGRVPLRHVPTGG